MSQTDVNWYTPPTYDFSGSTEERASVCEKISNEFNKADFWRCAEWSPDSTCILAQSESHVMHLFAHDRENKQLRSLGAHKQSSPILASKWYPSASTNIPESFCYVLSTREMPVKLVDGFSGKLRASYKIVDHRERFIAPHSMAFNPSATKLYCGFESAIEVFDVQYPGEGERIRTTPRRKEKGGFKGIISSLAFSPDGSGVYAASSLTHGIALLSEDSGSQILSFMEGSNAIGTTQALFDRVDPNILYTTSRPKYAIRAWDVRYPTVPTKTYTRTAKSNQRLGFDLDYGGRWLAAGDADGHIALYDVKSPLVEPVLSFQGHQDVIGSVSFNAFTPALLTASGSRHFTSNEPFSPQADEVSHHPQRESSRSGSVSGGSDGSDSDPEPGDIIVEDRADPDVPQPHHHLPRSQQGHLHPSPDATLKIWNFAPRLLEG